VNKSPFTELLTERAQQAGLPIEGRLLSALDAYFELLRRWNRKINLTGLNLDTPTAEGVDRLFIEPLLGARHVTPGTTRIIDLGSGGGSPAIPLTLAIAGASVTMVESRSKKSVFLLEAARELALAARVLTARYEDLLKREDLIQAFDTLTSRALRLGSREVAQVQNFVRPGGRLVLFRSAINSGGLAERSPLLFEYKQPLPGEGSELVVLQRRSAMFHVEHQPPKA
jgi:16S rRNA (guanine527-N7)-methyltransferase